MCAKSMKLKNKWCRSKLKMKFLLGYNMKTVTWWWGIFFLVGEMSKFSASGKLPPSPPCRENPAQRLNRYDAFEKYVAFHFSQFSLFYQCIIRKISLESSETCWEIPKFTSLNGIWFSPQCVKIRNCNAHIKLT